MKAKEIKDLIQFIADSGLGEIDIETEEIKLHVKRSSTTSQIVASVEQQPIISSAPAITTPEVNTQEKVQAHPENSGSKKDSASLDNLVEIKSPMIGTFYRAATPESDVFINIGDEVNKGDVVCIVEAMKLFNEIESDISGKIVKVLVDNASPIEYDQPLFLVEPN